MKSYDPTNALNGKAKVIFEVPSDVTEFDNLLGENGAALDEAVSNIIYRHTLPRLYSAVSDILVAGDAEKNISAFPKKQAVNKDGTPKVYQPKEGEAKPVNESDMDHLRGFYESADDAGKAALVSLLESTGASLPFYDKRAAAAAGPGKVSKGDLEAANQYILAGKAEKVVTFIESAVPDYKVVRDTDGNIGADSLARAIAALNKHELAKVKAAQAAQLEALG